MARAGEAAGSTEPLPPVKDEEKDVVGSIVEAASAEAASETAQAHVEL